MDGSEFLRHELIRSTKKIDGVPYFLVSEIDNTNQFVVQNFDYEHFYRGKFEFTDPATGLTRRGTPEEYGRSRIVASILNRNKSEKRMDLGAGSLNILREISEVRPRHSEVFVSIDISGPWNNSTPRDRSTMENGVSLIGDKKRIINDNGVVNVQYDMNSGRWPFVGDYFNTVVSCMALHHIQPRHKRDILTGIYYSLKVGGNVMVMDFFLRNGSLNKVTNAGQKGPRECAGYGQNIQDFLGLATEIGFTPDSNSLNLRNGGREFLTKAEHLDAMKDVSLSIQVNKASWFITLRKP